MAMNVCYPRSGDLATSVGSAYVELEWSLYLPIEQKVVATVTSEGSTYGEVRSSTGEGGIFRPAFEEAIRRLALTDAFRSVIDPPQAAVK